MSGVITFFRLFDRATGLVDSVVRGFILVFSLLIFGFVFTQVLVRFFLPFPIVWLPEAATFTSAYLGLWGSSTCLRAGYHLQVKVMWDILPETAGRFLSILIYLLVFVFSLFMTVYGYRMAELSLGQMSETATFPVFWMRLAMASGGVLIGLQAVTLALREVAALLDAPGHGAEATE